MTTVTSIGSSAIFTEPTVSLFQACRAEVIIERPATEVWNALTDLRFPAVKVWNPTVVSVQHISGEPRQENELVLITKSEVIDTVKEAPFYMRAIRIVPNLQRVVRIDTIEGTNGVFVDHSLYEQDGKTRLVYSGYIETRWMPARMVKTFDTKKAVSDMMNYLNHSHLLLKKAVEQAPRQV